MKRLVPSQVEGGRRVDLVISVGLLKDGTACVHRVLLDGRKIVEEKLMDYCGNWVDFDGTIHGIHKFKVRKDEGL